MELLLEIICEEMPPAHVKGALAQLKERLEAELRAARVPVQDLKAMGSGRRLCVVANMAEAQTGQEQVFIGPPKAIAFAADGTPGPAVLGFARSQKVEVKDLEIVTTPKGEYLGVKKMEKGKPAAEILAAALPRIMTAMSFPKTMRWGEGEYRFSRPVKNILCLFGEAVVPFEFCGVSSGTKTTGHKILDSRIIEVKSFRDYKEKLAAAMVVIDEEDRKSVILEKIQEKMNLLKAKTHPDEELLEKLTYDVECPCVIMGSFPESYLSLPLEVLSMAIREGLRGFSVVKDKRQLPHFLVVADNTQDANGLIQKGNERVLKARLEDARFFWEQDLKISLAKRAAGLKKIVFQEKLGSYEEKTQRVKKVASYLCDRIGEKDIKKDLLQAADLCKADLLTEMVREFPSLQGKIGGLYLKKEGFPAPVWQAVYEQYQPLGLDDSSPASLTGALLSIADKIDSIVGVVGIGIEVTGSSDPFGLRRNVHGVCKIILDKKLNMSLPKLLEKSVAVYGEILTRPAKDILDYGMNFFLGRLRYMFERMGYRYDLVNAALGPGLDDLNLPLLRLKALDSLKASPQFEPMILLARRVSNILRDQPLFRINSDLFEEKAERELYSLFFIVEENASSMIHKGDYVKAQSMIFRIQAPLNAFFDKVLVMAEDKKVRQNRLALLQGIRRIFLRIADYSQVVLDGETANKPAARGRHSPPEENGRGSDSERIR